MNIRAKMSCVPIGCLALLLTGTAWADVTIYDNGAPTSLAPTSQTHKTQSYA